MKCDGESRFLTILGECMGGFSSEHFAILVVFLVIFLAIASVIYLLIKYFRKNTQASKQNHVSSDGAKFIWKAVFVISIVVALISAYALFDLNSGLDNIQRQIDSSIFKDLASREAEPLIASIEHRISLFVIALIASIGCAVTSGVKILKKS